jgi:hypothetical protein
MPRAAVPGRPDTIHDLIYPSHGYRDQLKRQGIKPHDHVRDNRRYIKELQAKIAERKQISAANAEAAATTPGRKFMRVASRITADLSIPRPASAPSPRRQSAPAQRNFYAGKPHQPSQQVTRTGKTAAWVEPPLLVEDPTVSGPARRAPVPPRGGSENMPTQASPTTDYVAKNIAAAAQQRRASARSATREQRPLAPRTSPLGKLPAYLIDRKLELARIAAEEAANALPPGVPPNHHVLPKVRLMDSPCPLLPLS